ncbi:MAG TPA: hypothetical protein VKM72_07395 [Thermoanaerobaculia bacterium]|nr:hypothetical protein [Thermoanaerobaculia bacterium]
MNQNDVQELKSSWVQEPLAARELTSEAPVVIELTIERGPAPGEVAEVGEAATPAVVRFAMNKMKRVVIDVWWMGLAITIDERASGAAQSGSRPAQAA